MAEQSTDAEIAAKGFASTIDRNIIAEIAAARPSVSIIDTEPYAKNAREIAYAFTNARDVNAKNAREVAYAFTIAREINAKTAREVAYAYTTAKDITVYNAVEVVCVSIIDRSINAENVVEAPTASTIERNINAENVVEVGIAVMENSESDVNNVEEALYAHMGGGKMAASSAIRSIVPSNHAHAIQCHCAELVVYYPTCGPNIQTIKKP